MRILKLRFNKVEMSFGILGPNDIIEDPWLPEVKLDWLIINKVNMDHLCAKLVDRCEKSKFLILNEITGDLDKFFLKCPGKWTGLFLNNIGVGFVLQNLDCSGCLSLIVAGSPLVVCNLVSFIEREYLRLVKIKNNGGIFGATELLLGGVIRELRENKK
jgi:hypothetical protein